MLVFAKIKSVQQKIQSLQKGTIVGFVPTMGALHKGHVSLIEQAKKECGVVVVSIFVNPTQFDKKEDLINYPKTLDTDLEILKSTGVAIVFAPSAQEIYADNIVSENFDFNGLEHQMEGKYRSGHFSGVATVVKRLFQIVNPTKAYFGEKDFQQLQIIRNLVKQQNFDIEIVGCPIKREEDGLAMSSRNLRLNIEQRSAAPFIYKTLQAVKLKFGTESVISISNWVENEFKNNSILKLEYFEIANEETLIPIATKKENGKYRAFIAVFADKIRLIDNISL